MIAASRPAPLAAATRRILLTLGAAVFVVNLDARVVAPLLPAIAREMGLSIGQVGLLVSSYLIPYGLFQLGYGPLADRFGKIRVSALAMLVFSVGTVLCGARVSFATMVAFRALTGAAAAALFPLALAYIGDTVPFSARQGTIATLMASAGAAQAFSTTAGGVIADLLSWRLVFPLVGLLGGAITVALHLSRRQEVLRPPAEGVERVRYREVLRAPGYVALLALVTAEGVLFNGGFSFISGVLESRFHLRALTTGLVMSLAGVAQLAAARGLPALLRRVSSRGLLIAGGTVLGAGFLLVAAATTPLLVAIACTCIGAGFTGCHTNLQARATEAFPRARGTAVAVFAFALFLGGGVGAAAFAAVIDRVGYGATFAGAGLAFLVFTALAARLRPST
jgi:predicted MFS family arabinose efflux permease